ncbi:hypothetical protein GCM10027275_50160 [Rhabdobacter roseus]|uniref:XRE family transcriptional regulator n=1 Tax=Rhabdobacter roseus TaxID=1655419 RepID=A0A840U430_9BACT|nr:hypothetical protein [Rhabdobacter roseus]MBB5287088.1 hypothetical protein [Rhabdobacter roseus]
MFSERLKLFIDYTGRSINSFEISIGVSKGAIFKPIANKKTIGVEMLDKIISKYPELNIEWLISGQGEMLKGVQASQDPKGEMRVIPNSNQVLIDKDELLELQKIALRREKEDKEKAQKQLEQLKND